MAAMQRRLGDMAVDIGEALLAQVIGVRREADDAVAIEIARLR
jgi:hypothetical protein